MVWPAITESGRPVSSASSAGTSSLSSMSRPASRSSSWRSPASSVATSEVMAPQMLAHGGRDGGALTVGDGEQQAAIGIEPVGPRVRGEQEAGRHLDAAAQLVPAPPLSAEGAAAAHPLLVDATGRGGEQRPERGDHGDAQAEAEDRRLSQ